VSVNNGSHQSGSDTLIIFAADSFVVRTVATSEPADTIRIDSLLHQDTMNVEFTVSSWSGQPYSYMVRCKDTIYGHPAWFEYEGLGDTSYAVKFKVIEASAYMLYFAIALWAHGASYVKLEDIKVWRKR
jgi:hypothetical protein